MQLNDIFLFKKNFKQYLFDVFFIKIVYKKQLCYPHHSTVVSKSKLAQVNSEMKLIAMMNLGALNSVESGSPRRHGSLQRKTFREYHQRRQQPGYGNGTSAQIAALPRCAVCGLIGHRLWTMQKFEKLTNLAEKKGLESFYSRLFQQYFPHIYN